MRINFFDLRIDSSGRPLLEKEKGVNYETKKMDHPKEIAHMIENLVQIGQMAEEHCYMIALSSSCKVLGIFLISKGTVNISLITPREYYIRALLVGAVQTVLCHNHPSGDVKPSGSDIKITEKLKAAGELININLADHLIISRDSFYSFKEAEML